MSEFDDIKLGQIENEARDAFGVLFTKGYEITNVTDTAVTAIVQTINGPFELTFNPITRHIEKMIRVDYK